MRNKIFILVLLLIALAFVGRNYLIKTGIEGGVRAVTGLSLRIEKLDIGLIKPIIAIKRMQLFNPPQYADAIMMDIPEIFLDYDFSSLFKKKIHVKKARLHLNEFVIVKNKGGRMNLDSLKAVQAQEKEQPAASTPAGKKKAKMPDIQIDVLELKVGRVIYKDYSRSEKPSVMDFQLNLDERFENIKDPNALVGLIVFEALTTSGVSTIADFDVSAVKSVAGSTIKSAEAVTGEVIKTTGEALKKTTEGIKDIIKTPFGKKP